MGAVSLDGRDFLLAIRPTINRMIDAMTNDTIQTLRQTAETLAIETTPPALNLANRIRFTVYAWQDERLPLDEQENRLRKMVEMLRNGTAVTYTFKAI